MRRLLTILAIVIVLISTIVSNSKAQEDRCNDTSSNSLDYLLWNYKDFYSYSGSSIIYRPILVDSYQLANTAYQYPQKVLLLPVSEILAQYNYQFLWDFTNQTGSIKKGDNECSLSQMSYHLMSIHDKNGSITLRILPLGSSVVHFVDNNSVLWMDYASAVAFLRVFAGLDIIYP